jgi:hypothetical protein
MGYLVDVFSPRQQGSQVPLLPVRLRRTLSLTFRRVIQATLYLHTAVALSTPKSAAYRKRVLDREMSIQPTPLIPKRRSTNWLVASHRPTCITSVAIQEYLI